MPKKLQKIGKNLGSNLPTRVSAQQESSADAKPILNRKRYFQNDDDWLLKKKMTVFQHVWEIRGKKLVHIKILPKFAPNWYDFE